MQKVFYGRLKTEHKIKDLSVRESIVLGAMVIVIFYLGIFPQAALSKAKPAIMKTLHKKELSNTLKNDKTIYELNNKRESVPEYNFLATKAKRHKEPY